MGGVYLDHASATPLLPSALDAMRPWLEKAADPARVHTAGRAARAAVEDARDAVGAYLGTRPRDVVFTGTATEALNWVVYAACGLTPRSPGPWGRRIVVSAVEHTAVLDAARHGCAKAGFELATVPVDASGRVDPSSLDALGLCKNDALVAVQHVNHETGVVQPVEAVLERCRSAGVRLLVDACQSRGVPIPAADFAVVSGHKLGGPGGTGALGIGRRIRLDPLLVGGEQELLRRAGGENVAGIAGLGAACASPVPDTTPLRDRLAAGLGRLGGVRVLSEDAHRAPHIVAVTVDGVKGEALLVGLDRAGIACNSGSSCSADRLEPSHVLMAMGADADASLRFSFGRPSVAADVEAVLTALPPLVTQLRSLA